MTRNFASEIAHERVSGRWVTRFINRHKVHLISKWTTWLDRTHFLADFEVKCRLYFELVKDKMEEYNIEPHNSHDMHEKGLLMGLIGRSRIIFPGIKGIRWGSGHLFRTDYVTLWPVVVQMGARCRLASSTLLKMVQYNHPV